jgi:hypothetical protein
LNGASHESRRGDRTWFRDPPAGPADAAVLTESLGKTYPGGTVAVADLNLAVRRGEVLALVVYPVLAAATAFLLWQSTRFFTRRVIS